ncbi:MAG: phenylalanine 4-monooxygenase, partial [Bdellovibrionales bacterium]|nr:phenylalanine 4-monooxygenase [Bdellovibrionales bacterium]
MSNGHTYISHKLESNGLIPWTDEEDKTWATLVKKQDELIKGRACNEFIEGLKKLNLSKTKAPQINDINKVLMKETGWQVEAVPAVIPANDFFTLLSEKKFPAATFIRKSHELKYIQEPDIFHEIYGHCPLLTNQAYADFVHYYGKMTLKAPRKLIKYLFRIFWHTIEFGLVKTNDGIKIYGGGILSSPEETKYCLREDTQNKYMPYNSERVLRTPFRIDILQDHYFVIDCLDDLFSLTKQDFISLAEK